MIDYAGLCFKRNGLSISEFFEKEQSTDHSTGDPSSSQFESEALDSEAQYISTGSIHEDNLAKPPYFQAPAREYTFLPLLRVIRAKLSKTARNSIVMPR